MTRLDVIQLFNPLMPAVQALCERGCATRARLHVVYTRTIIRRDNYITRVFVCPCA